MCTFGILGLSCEAPAAWGPAREGSGGGGVRRRGGLAEGGPAEGGPAEGGPGERSPEGGRRRGVKDSKNDAQHQNLCSQGRRRWRRPGLGRSVSVGGRWNGTIRGTASAQASLAKIVSVKLCLAKLCLAKLRLAKLGFGQNWFGQTWFWPKLVWPKVGQVVWGLEQGFRGLGVSGVQGFFGVFGF